jgi:hypothetical protein
MEHRWSPRRTIHRDAMLYFQGLPVMQATVCNIGLDGAYVETPDAGLPRGTALELEFELSDHSPKSRHRLPALVMHQSLEGMGLMFRNFQQNAFEDIHAYLFQDRRHDAA